jgi:hypothetical protein
MHWLNAKNAPSRLELLALLDDPQAVTVRAQPTAMSAIKRLWRWWSAGLLAWARRTLKSFLPGVPEGR